MTATIGRHQPAFDHQIVELFGLKPGDSFLDLTLGDGSHTQEALSAGAKVVSVDVDTQSIERSIGFVGRQPLVVDADNLAPIESNFDWLVIHSNFNQISKICQVLHLPHFKFIWADLGTSQYQLADKSRGFSFQTEAPLDMRLDQKHQQVTAKDLVNVLHQQEIEELLALADESYAKVIARAIVKFRATRLISTTQELAQIISRVKPQKTSHIHPATKTFMALRMAVNLEREALSSMLDQLDSLLVPGGKIGIISFHSGEDRIVKHHFKQLISSGRYRAINHKPIEPNNNELQTNHKIRSAKLRLVQKHH